MKRRTRISNPLAAFAALLLVLSTWIGVDDADATKNSTVSQLPGIESADFEKNQDDTTDSLAKNEDGQSGGFTMSLFLFRHR